MSFSSAFYSKIFFTKVLFAAFLYLRFEFVIFLQKSIGTKAAHKMTTAVVRSWRLNELTGRMISVKFSNKNLYNRD